jgi:hypothetical protein
MVEWTSDVTAPDDLADVVHARDRRGRRRRRAVLGTLAVLAVFGVVAGLTVFWRTPTVEDRLVPAAPPRGTDAGASPVDVGWLPDGFGEPTAELVAPDAWVLSATGTDEPVSLLVYVSPVEPPKRGGPGRVGSVEVNGVTASTYSVPPHEVGAPPYGTVGPDADGPIEELTFRREPGQWIRIYAHLAGGTKDMGVTGDDVRRIAEKLVDRERRIPNLVSLSGAPGLQIATSSYNTLTGAKVAYIRAGQPVRRLKWNRYGPVSATTPTVEITIGDAFAARMAAGYEAGDPIRRTVAAGGQTVQLITNRLEGRNTALVTFADGQAAAVSVRGMTDGELVRLASGVTPGPDYRPIRR